MERFYGVGIPLNHIRSFEGVWVGVWTGEKDQKLHQVLLKVPDSRELKNTELGDLHGSFVCAVL